MTFRWPIAHWIKVLIPWIKVLIPWIKVLIPWIKVFNKPPGSPLTGCPNVIECGRKMILLLTKVVTSTSPTSNELSHP
jgi:hypothetical protein